MSSDGNVDGYRKRKGTGSAVHEMLGSSVGGQRHLWRYSQSVRPLGEKAHKNCKDYRGSGSKRETADLCSAHAAHLNRRERDNNVRRIPTDCHNVTIAEAPIIEAAELEQPCGNDPYGIKCCYHFPKTAKEDGEPTSNPNQDNMSSK